MASTTEEMQPVFGQRVLELIFRETRRTIALENWETISNLCGKQDEKLSLGFLIRNRLKCGNWNS